MMVAVMVVVIVIISVCFHEWAHGFMAYILGDKTPFYYRRLSLNPLRHLDLVGSCIVPIMLVVTGTQFVFGWAKPVPVNASCFKRPKWDMFFVAMAGPFINILIALVAVFVLKMFVYFSFLDSFSNMIHQVCLLFVYINCVLAIFNLIPIPPLDGSYGLLMIIPSYYHDFIQRYSIFGLLIVVCLLSFTRFQLWFDTGVKRMVSFLLSLYFEPSIYYAIFLLFFSFYTIGYKGYFMDIII